VTLTANGVSGQTDPEDDEPTQLFNLSDIALDFWPEGEDILYRGSFAELDITADALQGRNVPSLDGFGEARLKNGVAVVQSKPKSLRGQALDITNMELSSGEARISVSGPVSVDDAGLVDADLMIRLTNPQAVAEVLATAVPEEDKAGLWCARHDGKTAGHAAEDRQGQRHDGLHPARRHQAASLTPAQSAEQQSGRNPRVRPLFHVWFFRYAAA
jgi:hypothetical protein